MNSTPWRPSTFPLGDELSTDLKGHGIELSRTAKIKLRCNVASTVSESTTARVGYADTRCKHTQIHKKDPSAKKLYTFVFSCYLQLASLLFRRSLRIAYLFYSAILRIQTVYGHLSIFNF